MKAVLGTKRCSCNEGGVIEGVLGGGKSSAEAGGSGGNPEAEGDGGNPSFLAMLNDVDTGSGFSSSTYFHSMSPYAMLRLSTGSPRSPLPPGCNPETMQSLR